MSELPIVDFMRFIRLKSKYITKLFFVLALFPSCEHAWSTELVAHKAFYSIKLGAVSEGSEFVGAKGNVSQSIERTCNGWTMSQTLRMSLTTSDGGEVIQNLRFTGWESNDARRYHFFASNNVDGVRDDSRGFALKGMENGVGNASYRIPKNLKVSLPENTFFPIGHLRWLIERALAGEQLVSGTLFDGTRPSAQRVTAFIGKKKQYGQHITEDQGMLLGPLSQRPGWNIRMGFYELDSQDSVPSYELEILQLDNGITPTLILDYQDFTLLLNQERLNELPPPDCS